MLDVGRSNCSTSASRSMARMIPICPGPLVFEKNTLMRDVATWRCFEYGR